MKAGSKAAKAWGRKMARLRGNPRKKKSKHKAAKKKAWGPFTGKQIETKRVRAPVISTRKISGPTKELIAYYKEALNRAQKDQADVYKAVLGKSAQEYAVDKDFGLLKKAKGQYRKNEKSAATAVARLKKSEAARKRLEEELELAQKFGGIIEENPRRKKMSKKKRRSRRAKGSIHFSKKVKIKRGKKKYSVRVRGTIRVNPTLQEMSVVYGTAALGGVLYPWINYGVAKVINLLDTNVLGGAITKLTGQIDATVPNVSTPLMTLLAVVGLKIADKKMNLLDKLGPQGSSYAHHALDTVAMLSAAGIGMALADMAKLSPRSQGLSGGADFGNVQYYPGRSDGMGLIPSGMGHQIPQMGSGADFGRGADFGVIPQGLSGVDYIPEGDSIENHGIDESYYEGQGLGVTPEGMGDGQLG
jgi:hypothetical protein